MRCDQTGENSAGRYQVSHLRFVVLAVEVVRSGNRSSGARYGVYLLSSLVGSKTSFVGGINMSLTDGP
jgi:hypothetical protein